MDIAHQFEKIALLFTYDGFVAVLKQVTLPAVAQVVGDGVSGEQAAHESGQTILAAAQKEMGVIAEQRPGIDRCAALVRQAAQAVNETLAVDIILNDKALFYTAKDDVMQGAWRIKAGLAGHV
jgi:hypothetical protein